MEYPCNSSATASAVAHKGATVAKAKPSQQKRARERARQERQKEKEARRQENRARRAAAGPRQVGDEDPDIAGIIPGPQPPLWEDEDEGETE